MYRRRTFEKKYGGNTVLLCSFDNQAIDKIKGIEASKSPSEYSSTYAKFGYAGRITYNSTFPLYKNGINLINKDWTIDFWLTHLGNTGDSYSAIFCTSTTQATIIFRNDCNNGYMLCNGNNVWDYIHSGWVGRNQQNDHKPHHFAIVKQGNNLLLFIDGIKTGNTVSASAYDFSMDDIIFGNIGPTASTGRIPNAFIDEFRISNIARWTSNFTPPTKPY